MDHKAILRPRLPQKLHLKSRARRYCRSCSDNLDGAQDLCCPECGRYFSPSTDESVARKSPRRRRRANRLKLIALLLLPLIVFCSAGAAWVYWRQRVEIAAIEQVVAASNGYHLYTDHIGPALLTSLADSLGISTPVTAVELWLGDIKDVEKLQHLGELTNLRKIAILRTDIGNRGLYHLANIRSLRNLVLMDVNLSGIELESLKAFSDLDELDIVEKGLHFESVLRLEKELPNALISGNNEIDFNEWINHKMMPGGARSKTARRTLKNLIAHHYQVAPHPPQQHWEN